ncbi:MAG: DUF885 domain-containing protein [Candidatus Eisenbacteria bacterium]|nr:DUF885 domain-containing protein [Candidatus Eisenbacteria bacterium]
MIRKSVRLIPHHLYARKRLVARRPLARDFALNLRTAGLPAPALLTLGLLAVSLFAAISPSIVPSLSAQGAVSSVPTASEIAISSRAVPEAIVASSTAPEAILAFPTAATVTKADSYFVTLAKDYFAWDCENHPVHATYIGVHDFDGELDDVSPVAIKKEEKATAEFLKKLLSFDPSELSATHRYDYVILKDHLEYELFSMRELKEWEKSPLAYTDIAGGAIRSLLSRDFAPLDVRLRAVISRLDKFPRLLEEAKANIKSSSRVATETAARQNEGLISYIEEDVRRTASLAPALEESVRVASDVATEALESFGTYLEKDLLPRSTADYRLGKELYAKKLRYALGGDVTTDELVAKARKRYEEVRKEAIQLSRKIHDDMVREGRLKNHVHGQGVAADEEIAREVFSELAKDHAEADGLLDQCKQYCAQLESFIRKKDIIALPANQKLDVEWTPEFERGVADGGLESPGPFDANQKAFFYVAPVHEEWTKEEKESFLREYNDYLEMIFCMHEALPGHYVQGWYANRFPSLVRAMLENGAFVEGWAVYSEQMMLDAGYGAGDPKLQLSELKWLLRVIINAIIDPELHTGAMTEKEAIDLMIHGGFQEEREANGKIVRASLTSTQLTTYFVGVDGIRDIERLYRKKMGENYSQREFNEKLLSFGSPPLKYLKEMMLEETQ